MLPPFQEWQKYFKVKILPSAFLGSAKGLSNKALLSRAERDN